MAAWLSLTLLLVIGTTAGATEISAEIFRTNRTQGAKGSRIFSISCHGKKPARCAILETLGSSVVSSKVIPGSEGRKIVESFAKSVAKEKGRPIADPAFRWRVAIDGKETVGACERGAECASRMPAMQLEAALVRRILR